MFALEKYRISYWRACSTANYWIFYTLSEGIILLSQSLYRIEGVLTDPIKYTYS